MQLVPSLAPAAVDLTEIPPAAEIALWLVGAVIVALIVAWLVRAVIKLLARRWSLAGELHERARYPVRALLIVLALWIALRLATEPSSWTPGAEQALTILLIAAVAWLLIDVMRLVESALKARWTPVEGEDSRYAARVRTQIQVLRQILEALVIVVAIAVALLTFPGMRAVGASLLASAGLLSIVAGVAAQNSLSNVFAGLQIAFSDPVRLGDVVVVEGEWGRIEEITLTYVVVHLWDDRRLILPSTYFTTTVFQNWTKRDTHLLGTVELDVDWSVPMEAMRVEVSRLLAQTDMWDRRVNVLQVTDATGGYVRVRVLASAVDAPTLWDLRCYLREGVVAWLRTQTAAGLPRTRFETVGRKTWEATLEEAEREAVARRSAEPATPAAPERTGGEPGRRPADETAVTPALGAEPDSGSSDAAATAARLFTGTIEAIGRSLPFRGQPRGEGGTTGSGVTPLPAPEAASGATDQQASPPARRPGNRDSAGGHEDTAIVPVAGSGTASPGAVPRVSRAVRVSELPPFPPPSRSPHRPPSVPPDDSSPDAGDDPGE